MKNFNFYTGKTKASFTYYDLIDMKPCNIKVIMNNYLKSMRLLTFFINQVQANEVKLNYLQILKDNDNNIVLVWEGKLDLCIAYSL